MSEDTELKDFINAPERKLTYNKLGGVNGFKYLDGELVEFTLSDDEVKLIDEDTLIAEFDNDALNSMLALNDFKAKRQNELDNAIVETSTGKFFDADEKSIQRMLSAIVALSGQPDSYIVQWSTADVDTGVMTECELHEIKEAHTLAVMNMAAIWAR